jgi:hypothetical protein
MTYFLRRVVACGTTLAIQRVGGFFDIIALNYRALTDAPNEISQRQLCIGAARTGRFE